MNILQRNQIHVAVKLMVRGKEVLEGLMLVVVWIAVAGGMVVFEADARFPGRLCPRIAAEGRNRISPMFEARISQRGRGCIIEMPELSHQLERVIPASQFTGIGFHPQADCVDIPRGGTVWAGRSI